MWSWSSRNIMGFIPDGFWRMKQKKIGATSITPTFWATDRRWGFPLENNVSCLQKPDLLSFQILYLWCMSSSICPAQNLCHRLLPSLFVVIFSHKPFQKQDNDEDKTWRMRCSEKQLHGVSITNQFGQGFLCSYGVNMIWPQHNRTDVKAGATHLLPSIKLTTFHQQLCLRLKQHGFQ